MKKRLIIIGTLLFVVLIVGFIIYKVNTNYDGDYEIVVEIIDDYSPDRKLIVKRNGKATLKYKYIIYRKDDINAILCYSDNAVVNVFSLDLDELVIVLPDDTEKIAKVVKEEK